MSDQRPRIRQALTAIPDYRAGRTAPVDAYKLSSNENPYPPLPGVVAAVLDAAATANRYPDFMTTRLVNALADRFAVGTEQVALGTGSVAVLAQVIQAVADQGDEVVFAWRSFEAYPILVQLAGAVDIRVPLTTDLRHDLPGMVAAITDRTRLVVVCTPNNPTGPAVRRSELEDFLAKVPDDVLVAIDEAYIEFVQPDEQLDTLSLVSAHPNVAVLRTFSKAFGLAGLRVGYAIAQPQVAAAIRKTQMPFGVSAVAEQAALASLANEPALMDRVANLVNERQRVVSELASAGVKVPDSQGNFIWFASGSRTEEFAAACEQAGIIVRAFSGEGVRVTIGETPANDRFIDVAKAFDESDLG